MASDPVIHVIDDDEAARDALLFLLSSSDYAVRGYGSAQAFLEDLPDDSGGCVITDVRMPDIDGIELLRRLRGKETAWPVIIITGHGDVPLAVEAMKLGAADFIEKPYESDVLLGAVRAALEGRSQSTRRDTEKAAIGEKISALSGREKQVMDGLVAGQPNKIIAHELGISPRTVEIYRANVMAKMQAKSLSHLVRMALVVAP